MTAMLRGFLGLVLAWLMLVGLGAAAQAQDGGVLPVPALSSHVIDQASALAAPQRQALDDKLAAFEQERGTQLVVLIVPTTQPEDIAAYAQRVGDTWKIGRREVGDGLLLVVALNDRRVRIEVAKALEGAVPDLAASRIIEGAIVPAFKRGDVAAGIDAGVDQLMARVRGEDLPLPEPGGTRSPPGAGRSSRCRPRAGRRRRCPRAGWWARSARPAACRALAQRPRACRRSPGAAERSARWPDR